MNNILFRDSDTEQGIVECEFTEKNEGRKERKKEKEGRMK